MKKLLLILVLAACVIFPQKKYIAGSDSILTYANAITQPGSLFICIKDSNNSYTDSLVAEVKNPFGNWVTVGVKGIDNGTYYTSIVPGNGATIYYQLNFGLISPGEFRVRRTNVANRTINCQASIERRDTE